MQGAEGQAPPAQRVHLLRLTEGGIAVDLRPCSEDAIRLRNAVQTGADELDRGEPARTDPLGRFHGPHLDDRPGGAGHGRAR